MKTENKVICQPNHHWNHGTVKKEEWKLIYPDGTIKIYADLRKGFEDVMEWQKSND